MVHPRQDDITALWSRQQGVAHAALTRPGTTLVPHADRPHVVIDVFRTGVTTLIHTHPRWTDELNQVLEQFPPDAALTAADLMRHALSDSLACSPLTELHYLEPRRFRRCHQAGLRVLLGAEQEAFERFVQRCPVEDRKTADLSWDSSVLLAAFEGVDIVSCAMVTRLDESCVDVAVLTLPAARGRGWGKAVVSAACQWMLERNAVLQYRVDTSNASSLALARGLGLVALAWEETLHINLAPHRSPNRVFSGTKPAL
jgi:GNAT superfamily N-acetyltransferase